MNPKATLKQARNLFKKGDFALVVRLLEKEVFHFRSNPDYYLLLSLCYLRLNNTKTAQTYLESAKNLHPNSEEISQVRAILDIARGNSEQALAHWLSVLDQDPHDPTAQNGLEVLRIHSQEPLSAWINSEDFASLYPIPNLQFTRYMGKMTRHRPTRRMRSRRSTFSLLPLLKGLAILLSVSVSGFLIIFVGNWLYHSFQQWTTPKRSGVDVIMISPQDTLLSDKTNNERIEAGKVPYQYQLSEDEVIQLFAMTKDAFNNYQDNLAQTHINRLMRSNASDEVKRKAFSLSQFTETPTFATFKSGPNFQEVSRDAALYDNVYILWRGKITNVHEEPEGLVFDFLVGYTDNRVLDGVIHAHMTFDTFLENGMNVELIGQVEAAKGLPPFSLKVTSLHLLES